MWLPYSDPLGSCGTTARPTIHAEGLEGGWERREASDGRGWIVKQKMTGLCRQHGGTPGAVPVGVCACQFLSGLDLRWLWAAPALDVHLLHLFVPVKLQFALRFSLHFSHLQGTIRYCLDSSPLMSTLLCASPVVRAELWTLVHLWRPRFPL